MVLGVEQLSISIRVATVVVPVAVYFLILGLLNSRRHPQLLSGRQDFAVLLVAMSPLVALPVLSVVGPSLLVVLGIVGALVGGIFLLAPPKGSWVIYNIPAGEAVRAVEQALRGMGLKTQRQDSLIRIAEENATIQIGGFRLLRNVSIRLRGGSEDLANRFAGALASVLSGARAETSPTAVALLLVATAMLVAPLALMARHAPEIVRLLTDMLP